MFSFLHHNKVSVAGPALRLATSPFQDAYKNMPGCFMAAARHNRPTIIIYGGTIQPGIRHVDCPSMGFKTGDTVNISDAFESYGLRSFTELVFSNDLIYSYPRRLLLGKSTTNSD